jgi:hypothetical protein
VEIKRGKRLEVALHKIVFESLVGNTHLTYFSYGLVDRGKVLEFDQFQKCLQIYI